MTTDTDRRNLASCEDIAQHWPAPRDELRDALDLATYCAATLGRPCWISAGRPTPGRHLVWHVTDFQTADPLARVMPDGLITTNPDGRPELLPACPVGRSNPAPVGRIVQHASPAELRASGALA